MAKDPVCHMDVEETKAAGESEYRGQKYYFCNTMCKKRFDENPDKFLPHASEGKSH